MKKIVYFVFAFIQFLLSNSQEIVKVEMLDSSFNVSNTENYYIKRTIKSIENSTNFNVEEVRKTGETFAIYQVTDYVTMIKDGNRKTFYKNGQQRTSSAYNNNLAFGEYLEFYEDGKPRVIGENKIENNVSKLYIKDFWDKDGNHKVINFNGEIELLKANKLYRVPVKEGRYNGEMKPVDETYPYTIIFYENGDLVKGELHKSPTVIRFFNSNEVPASPIGGMEKFKNDFIDQLINKFSNKKLNIDVLIKFVVLEDGSLTNVEFLKSAGSKVDKKIEELLCKQNKWEPGIKYGIEVKTICKLPLRLNVTFE
ncbi:Protein of unknown function [Flavobacterium indicum GPTSA100-9 = DSM 17447]|uniref:TonB C-terminal domain-containing protein n=1 Tax=Flavobacterium indicum (strain DSM 17447 / CIP 109464 / GPTSA100-9) TaxID=1094466 RepID=H8XQH1_FLAIG|nr:hypothetical protein [Flavobacterium indicum]CCG52465.1 Protein of unknown function [Flavobacterium indicum GPTSA100-9 = DSM 17447]